MRQCLRRGTGECVIDPSHPCGQCIAPGPAECPYVYLLDMRRFKT